MAAYMLVNIGSGNSLVPDGTKPLPEPMLTYHHKVPRLKIDNELKFKPMWKKVENSLVKWS